MKKCLLLLLLLVSFLQFNFAQNFFTDESKAYSMPLLSKNNKDIILSWTEKDAQGLSAFCMAVSKDNGANFSDKRTIVEGYAIGNSRLMRAKVLAKKDGTLFAVFMNNPNVTSPPTGRGPKGSAVSFAVSKDKGLTWTNPKYVDTDATPDLMRGFFDAVVLANDEIAVAYLKDVKGSTKHEERDLRMSITKNGEFQTEKIVDAIVCDCCNINMLVDAAGVLNVYYRDNNDDIRDIAHVASKDNGMTFSDSKIVYKDNWMIKGCPHNGSSTAEFNNQKLVTWFSGNEKDPGLKLSTQDGKKLAFINDASAKNASIYSDSKNAVLIWEQTNNEKPGIAYKVMDKKGISDTKWFTDSNILNATGIVLGDKIMVAYESKNTNNKNSIKLSTIKL